MFFFYFCWEKCTQTPESDMQKLRKFCFNFKILDYHKLTDKTNTILCLNEKNTEILPTDT